MKLTPESVYDQLVRLEASGLRTFGRTITSVMVQDWYDALADVSASPAELAGAVTRLLRTTDEYPTLHQLLAAIQNARRPNYIVLEGPAPPGESGEIDPERRRELRRRLDELGGKIAGGAE